MKFPVKKILYWSTVIKLVLLVLVTGVWWLLNKYPVGSWFREGFSDSVTAETGSTKGLVAVDDNREHPIIFTNDVERGEFAFQPEGGGALRAPRSKIPNRIWMFWEGPMNPVVEYCVASWKAYHPGYEVVLLNKTNCHEYLDVDIRSLRHAEESITRFSDFLRCLILSKHGGFWVDASIICHAPVSWVHAVQNTFQVELVGYYHGSTDAEFLSYSPIIENWFFACVPGSAFMRDWCAEFLRFNDYATVEDYLKSLRDDDHIQFVNLQYLDYLTMHAAAQKVFQSHRDMYRMYLFCANCGPFKYLDEVGWGDTVRAVDHITGETTAKNYQNYTMVKLCNDQRRELLTRDDATMRRAFSHFRMQNT